MYLLQNTTGDLSKLAPDQCSRIVSMLEQAREWHGPISSAELLKDLSHRFHK
jgi:hypothetical protein